MKMMCLLWFCLRFIETQKTVASKVCLADEHIQKYGVFTAVYNENLLQITTSIHCYIYKNHQYIFFPVKLSTYLEQELSYIAFSIFESIFSCFRYYVQMPLSLSNMRGVLVTSQPPLITVLGKSSAICSVFCFACQHSACRHVPERQAAFAYNPKALKLGKRNQNFISLALNFDFYVAFICILAESWQHLPTNLLYFSVYMMLLI